MLDELKKTVEYYGITSEVDYDLEKKRLECTVMCGDKRRMFYTASVLGLSTGFVSMVDMLVEELRLESDLQRRIATIEEVLMSGEAHIKINADEPDDYVGKMIKKMISMADGASFQVQEGNR